MKYLDTLMCWTGKENLTCQTNFRSALSLLHILDILAQKVNTNPSRNLQSYSEKLAELVCHTF